MSERMEEVANMMYLAVGSRLYRHLKAGEYASAAHLVRRGNEAGLFTDPHDWRTAALLQYDLLRDFPKLRRRAR